MEHPDRDRLVTFLTVGLVLLAVGFYAFGPTGPLGWVLYPVEYGEATVTISDENGSTLATVDVRIAENGREHYIGLSETDSLQPGDGMLFVFDGSADRAFVMRNMDFPLDIVFIAPNGTIAAIRHAPVPSETPGDDRRRYRGTGQYVLEVPRGYTNATGIDVGDQVAVPANVTR